MKEFQDIEKSRKRHIRRRNSRAVEIAVWVLVALEAWRLFGDYAIAQLARYL